MHGTGCDSTFEEQMERIYFVAGVRTRTELATFFGVRESAVSDAVRRKKIPAEWLVFLARTSDVHPEWILAGRGTRGMRRPERYETQDEARTHREEEEALQRLPSRMLANELVRRTLLSPVDDAFRFGPEQIAD